MIISRILRWVFLLLVPFCGVCADPCCVNAGHVHYDGKKMVLQGDPTIEHDMGVVSAKEMIVSFAPRGCKSGCKSLFDTVQLNNSVHVVFQDGGELFCAESRLNADSECLCSSNSEQEYVTYKSYGGKKNKDDFSLELQSRSLKVLLKENASTTEKSAKKNISSIVAENDVTVNYDHQFTGLSDRLIWNDGDGLLTMLGDITIFREGLGKLENFREVRAYQTVVDGKKLLHSMEADGITRIEYSGAPQGKSTLICHGKARLDHQQMELCLYSPADADGSIPKDKQVFFQDPKGDIYADRVQIFYRVDKGVLTPIKIMLIGNVSLLNRIAPINGGKVISQHIAADEVEFTPTTNEIYFKANHGGKVLLVDDVNQLQMSASALKMIRDHTTGKESITGIGDVQFRLVEQELFRINELRQKISLER